MSKRGLSVLALGVLASVVVHAQNTSIVLNDGGIKFPDGTVQSTAAGGPPAPVNRTGQTQCWDSAGTEIVCAGTGQDGDLRRGVAWPDPRFMDYGDGTVTDNLTGLIWLKDAGCFGHDVTWTDSFSEIAAFNSGIDRGCPEYSAGAYDDWRLPTILELISLVDWGSGSVLPDGHPFLFTGIGLCTYWTSTTDEAEPENAWLSVFGQSVDQVQVDTTPKTGDFCVWPVRGGH